MANELTYSQMCFITQRFLFSLYNIFSFKHMFYNQMTLIISLSI